MSAPPYRLASGAAPPPQPPEKRRRRWVARYLAAAVLTAIMAVFTLPDLLFGLDEYSPFAQLVAMRPWLVLGDAVVLAILVLVSVFERRALPFAAGVLVVLMIAAGMVLPRVVPDPVPAGGTAFRVLAFNTFDGSADVGRLAALIEQQRPDVVALSETGHRFADRLAPRIEHLGYQVHPTGERRDDDVEEVTAVVSDRLGAVDVRADETSTFPHIELTGAGLGPLRVVVFHSVAPVPGSVPDWVRDLSLVRQWCGGSTPAIVAGDFNATLDHSVLRDATTGCGDAASQRGAGLVPTWGPSPTIRRFGPQIDHVFATDGIVAETFEVHDVADSDHRAVLTTLRLPG
jgi:endonuclease/exonuclease/phosphatase (EEP) superfamily protein YafD